MTRDKSPRRGFLVWLAGPSRQYIARAPSTIDFYRKIGAALLIPFTLGTAGVSVLLHTATEAEGIDPKLVAVAVATGVLIVVADRMLIAARAGRARGRFFLNLLRVVLSVALAAVVSEPLIASLFADEAVKADRQAFRQEIASHRDAVTRDFRARIAVANSMAEDEVQDLDDEIARLDQDADEAREQAARADLICFHEIAGADGGRGGPAGDGPQAAVICPRADKRVKAANAEEDEAEREIRSLIADKKAAREPVKALQRQRDRKLEKIASRRYEQDLGAWERMELARAHVGWWYWLAILAGLLVLDTLAVMSKMLKGKTAYDEQVDSDDEVAAAAARERVENIDDQRRHRRRLAEIAREGDVADQEEMLAIRSEVRARLHDGRVEREVARALYEDERRAKGESGDAAPGRENRVSRPPWPTSSRSISISATSGTRVVAIRQRKLVVERQPFASGGFSFVHFAQWERALQPDRPFERGVMALKLPWGDPFGDGLTLDDRGAERLERGRRALKKETDFYATNPTLMYAPRLVTERGGDRPLLLLEYLERGDLRTWLFPEPGAAFTVHCDQILAWMANVIAILEEIWGLSRVLVDGKMENLLVRGRLNEPPFAPGFRGPTFMPNAAGGLVACDFGSVVPRGDILHSHTGIYDPPEYRVPKPRADLAGDVFTSLGITFFRVCTRGQMPEQNKQGEVTKPDPRRFNPQVPAPVAELIARWLSTDPAARIPVDRNEFPRRIVEGLMDSVRRVYLECENACQTGTVILPRGDRGMAV